MRITYLGHAGFLVETAQTIIIMDAWLSPLGAFDAAWFQFPCNHHLLELVQNKLKEKGKEKYIYVSHEHKDHFCQWTLDRIDSEDFTFVIPKFRRPVLYDLIRKIPCKKIVLCESDTRIEIPGGYLKIYAEDSELNRDSGIFVCADEQRFLNINDCKIHDRLPRIRMDEGKIDAFAAQFSGATWHPVCYDYDEKTYQRISRKKMFSKFEATARAIEAVQPDVFLPSAGPPCFLDPQLFPINFQAINIFPRNAQLIDFLEKRLNLSEPVYPPSPSKARDTNVKPSKGEDTNVKPSETENKRNEKFFTKQKTSPFGGWGKDVLYIPDLMPADRLNILTKTTEYQAKNRVSEQNFEPYLKEYASRYNDFFLSRKKDISSKKNIHIQARLIDELDKKLSRFTLAHQIDRPLYFQFSNEKECITRIDFKQKKAEAVSAIESGDFYRLEVPSYQLGRVLDGYLTWEDFSLTFRMRLNREPDVYQTIIQGFLILEAEDLEPFCSHILALENNNERITVEAGGCLYSVDKLCPHQGADLSQGWIEEDRYLVCPRHRWRFDLHQDGACMDNEGTVNCIALEDE